MISKKLKKKCFEEGRYDMKYNITDKELLQSDQVCDKYDYLLAVACGAIGGIIDIFLIKTPKNSILGTWTDEQIDTVVKRFAKIVGWKPKEAQSESVASAISYLEKKFKVNYDQRYCSEIGNLFSMSTKNHHIMSLSHAPDILGLFFSILNQFTSSSSFIAKGKIISIHTETYELQGSNFISNLFCGIANWFGHIMSDIAGSSGSRGGKGRGTGVVIPFYELFQCCKFGKFNVKKDKQDLATIAVRAFEEGYDFRFGLATSIPVILTELSIRLIWSLRKHFQYKKSIKECIPNSSHKDLRVMLLFGNGTLCLMDGMDAAVHSGGNFLFFFMRLNLIAWFRLVALVFREVCIRVGIDDVLQKDINAYKEIKKTLQLYLNELERIDIELFREETQKYQKVINPIKNMNSNEELTTILLNVFEELKIDYPWNGDFEEHMLNKNGTLLFK